MAYANMTVSPGSGRPEIDDILRCPSLDQQYVKKARTEYYELLKTEVRLAEKDLNMVIINIVTTFCSLFTFFLNK
jgi:hypothetical protein